MHRGKGQIISRQPAGNARSWQPWLASGITAQNRAGGSGAPPCRVFTITPAGGDPGWWEAAGQGMAVTLTLALPCLCRS